jgi:hypothetical protein
MNRSERKDNEMAGQASMQPKSPDAGAAGAPEPKGRPNSDRSKTEEQLEKGLPPEQKREKPASSAETKAPRKRR